MRRRRLGQTNRPKSGHGEPQLPKDTDSTGQRLFATRQPI